MKPRFSANLGLLWPDRPLLDRIDAAAAAGFRAIELHWPYDIPARRIRQKCEANGLKLLSLNTPPGDLDAGDFGLAALPSRGAEFRRSFEMAASYAREAGAMSIHVMAGIVGSEDREEARQAMLRNLDFASDEAPEMTLLLEPLNPRDRPGYFYSRIADAAAIVDELQRPNILLMFDAYHAGMTGEHVSECLERHIDAIGHVQIAAVPSRAEPDEGAVDYMVVFDTLDRLGYTGWIGCEYNPRASTDAGLHWISDFGLSVRDTGRKP